MNPVKKRLFEFLATVVVALLIGPAQAEEEVAVFSGTGSRVTAEFEVNGPWLLDWSVTGLSGSKGLGIEILLVESDLLRSHGTVLNTYEPGARSSATIRLRSRA